MRSTWSTLLFAFCLTSSSYGGLGCSDCRVTGQDPVVYEGGKTNAAKTVYESMPADAPLLHFPQGRTYTFYHGLGKIPYDASILVSFCEQPFTEDDDECKSKSHNAAPSAGNLGLFEDWDEEKITIRNDTCENNFYVRIVILADQSTNGAGGDGGASGTN